MTVTALYNERLLVLKEIRKMKKKQKQKFAIRTYLTCDLQLEADFTALELTKIIHITLVNRKKGKTK